MKIFELHIWQHDDFFKRHFHFSAFTRLTMSFRLIFYARCNIYIIVCIGVSAPSASKTPPLFLVKPFLKSVNCPSVPFQAIPLSILLTPPSLKIGFFSRPQKYLIFSSSIPSHLLKVTKFFVKLSRFEFLVMTEKTLFAYKLFFVIKYFRFKLIFYVTLQPPLKTKVLPISSPSF